LYTIIEDEHVTRVPPQLLGESFNQAVEDVARDTLCGRILDMKDENNHITGKCYVISLIDIEPIGEASIVHGDGGVYQSIKYRALAYTPKMQEVVDALVISVVPKLGVFLRFGPFEGLLHISQIMDDRIDVDPSNQRLIGKETGREIRVGDILRVRIVLLNLSSSSVKDSKIGFTMKQTGLGKKEWIKLAKNKEEN
jgi:DNA-directed RNA polymerase subunit E'